MGASRGPDTTVLGFFFFALCASTMSNTSSIIITISVLSFFIVKAQSVYLFFFITDTREQLCNRSCSNKHTHLLYYKNCSRGRRTCAETSVKSQSLK
jgi:hypothetical protein